MNKTLVIFQCFLCLTVLIFAMIINRKADSRALTAGAFEESRFNDTLSDFANNLYEDYYVI